MAQTLPMPADGGRVLVIGDVHGCANELKRLLRNADLTKRDRVIFVGDLVNTGPASGEVVRIAREIKALAVVGNHEWRLLRARDQRDPTLLKSPDHATIRSLRPADWQYLETMSLTIELPEINTVIVHGGFLPNLPWKSQGPSIVTEIQVIDEEGNPAKRSKYREGKPWTAFWRTPPFVVYGHTPMHTVARAPYALGIDTGCVYGGALTGVLLPERRIIQVSAARQYAD